MNFIVAGKKLENLNNKASKKSQKTLNDVPNKMPKVLAN